MPCILLAEPDPVTRNFLSMKFKEAGYDVDVAYNGQEAILLLSIRRHDLIVSGFEMRGKNGVELLREIRQHSEFATIPFVLFTKVDPRTQTDNRDYVSLMHEINALGAVFLPKTAQHLRSFPIQAIVKRLAAASWA